MRIRFTKHALKRLSKRCLKFGLNFDEAKEKAERTIRCGKPIKIKYKKGYSITHYYYVKEGFSFYVYCREKESKGHKRYYVKTVIIRWGRR